MRVPGSMFVCALGISLHMWPFTPTANHDRGASPGVRLMFATGRAQGKASVTFGVSWSVCQRTCACVRETG